MHNEKLPRRSQDTGFEPNYALRRIMVGSLATLSVLGGVKAVELANGAVDHITDMTQPKVVSRKVATVENRSTVYNTVRWATNELAADFSIPVDEIADVTTSAQEASQEIQEQEGRNTIQPGDAVEVVLMKKHRGGYFVKVDPAPKVIQVITSN